MTQWMAEYLATPFVEVLAVHEHHHPRTRIRRKPFYVGFRHGFPSALLSSRGNELS